MEKEKEKEKVHKKLLEKDQNEEGNDMKIGKNSSYK